MSDRIMLGAIAVFAGLGLAVALFIPFIAISYRRRGSVSALWLLGWVALLSYTMALWTYTLMPLPAEGYRCVGTQLTPFASLHDILKYPHASAGQVLRNPAVQQVAFNIMLFMPFGFLLRTMFRRGILMATFGGFGISLFIELTQRTGIWGIFPCAYRLFDVDDLMANTLGALLGSILAWAFIPRRSADRDPRLPRPVTAGRRLLAMACDVLFLTLLGGMLAIGWRAWEMYGQGIEYDKLDTSVESLLSVWVPLGVHFVWIMASGQTIGESATLLRGRSAGLPAPLARPLRFLAGIGGYGILSAASFPLSGPLLFVLVAASLVMVFTSRGHRGLAAAVAGMDIEDARTRSQPVRR